MEVTQILTVLTAIYNNCSAKNRKSLKTLAEELHVSVNTLHKVRGVLQNMGLLIIEGDRRTQKVYWNNHKSTPNTSMAKEVNKRFCIYKPIPKTKRYPSLEKALKALVLEGYAGIIVSTKKVGIKTVKTIIDLKDIKVED